MGQTVSRSVWPALWPSGKTLTQRSGASGKCERVPGCRQRTVGVVLRPARFPTSVRGQSYGLFDVEFEFCSASCSELTLHHARSCHHLSTPSIHHPLSSIQAKGSPASALHCSTY
ncbi:hypothetical protein ElyMa_004517400 [Elysia marginata]|uniref:Uncharacterized protein n=1 Tax=Elysia marginata TaxID=1093978 RepID=A0AAV4HP90_9GAST|nr:hypothetical protein ElyMa_004517400 [Elysia marginata]